MGFFEKIFGKGEPKAEKKAAETFLFLRGYTPVFTDFAGSIYESELIRAALDAHGRHAMKLAPNIVGAAQSGIQGRLKYSPNAWQTWPQYLYRHVQILYCRNTVFTVKVRGADGAATGIIDVVPEKWELVEYAGELWIRFFFDKGRRGAEKLSDVGICTRFQMQNELFGENNQVMKSTLDLIELQKQGIAEGIKNGATYRFYATHSNFQKDADLAKERKRFDEENFRKDSGGGGVLLFPNTYKDVKQAENKAFVVDADQQKLIKENVFDYFAINDEVIQNQAFGDKWLAFYEGAVEPVAIMTGDAITRTLFTEREIQRGNRFFLTSNRLQYMSNADKLTAIQTMADRGLMTRNELREIANLAPLPEPYGSQIPARGEYYNVNGPEEKDTTT